MLFYILCSNFIWEARASIINLIKLPWNFAPFFQSNELGDPASNYSSNFVWKILKEKNLKIIHWFFMSVKSLCQLFFNLSEYFKWNFIKSWKQGNSDEYYSISQKLKWPEKIDIKTTTIPLSRKEIFLSLKKLRKFHIESLDLQLFDILPLDLMICR